MTIIILLISPPPPPPQTLMKSSCSFLALFPWGHLFCAVTPYFQQRVLSPRSDRSGVMECVDTKSAFLPAQFISSPLTLQAFGSFQLPSWLEFAKLILLSLFVVIERELPHFFFPSLLYEITNVFFFSSSINGLNGALLSDLPPPFASLPLPPFCRAGSSSSSRLIVPGFIPVVPTPPPFSFPTFQFKASGSLPERSKISLFGFPYYPPRNFLSPSRSGYLSDPYTRFFKVMTSSKARRRPAIFPPTSHP